MRRLTIVRVTNIYNKSRGPAGKINFFFVCKWPMFSRKQLFITLKVFTCCWVSTCFSTGGSLAHLVLHIQGLFSVLYTLTLQPVIGANGSPVVTKVFSSSGRVLGCLSYLSFIYLFKQCPRDRFSPGFNDYLLDQRRVGSNNLWPQCVFKSLSIS